ncbi:MAG: sulfatase-like hydrolase/transferase [Alistipes sp.]|nr:sulfatase-like hydrolase/transferase [Alistipes sp.]
MKRKIILIVATFLSSLVLMAVQKPIFLIWYAQQSAEATAAELAGVSLHGALLDMTMAGYLSVIPWLLMLVAVWVVIPENTMRRLLNGYYAAMSFVVALIVAVDIGLFRYWGFRIDSTIFPYLATPKEAAASVTWGDFIPATTFFLIYGAVMFLAWRPLYRLYATKKESLKQRILSTSALIFVGGLLFLAIRGGVGPATANVSKVYFSDNMFLNQAATNPVFSLLSSSMRSELKADDYRYFPAAECEELFSELIAGQPAHHSDTILTTSRPNIVLILLEGFGRTTATTSHQGRAVTPNLDALRSEGIWFENMFANSFRTDRGTVAVMSGHPAHPVASIMKYPQKAHTLPAIATSLKAEGYATYFTYGGDANFTNTASYLYGTGIEHITDQKTLSFDTPAAKWGYADDVVCDYFATEILKLAEQDKPFFSALLTLSSHEPFEVEFDAFDDKVLNSTAFTDYHVGKMIQRWRNSSAWDDMLIILIADHGISYPEGIKIGSVPRQRIPMLWTGGAVKTPFEVEAYASQCDLAATLLGQLGIDHSRFTFSKDIFNPQVKKFAYWSFNNGFGIINDKGSVIYDCTGDKVISSESAEEATSEELLRAGKAITQTIHNDICNR